MPEHLTGELPRDIAHLAAIGTFPGSVPEVLEHGSHALFIQLGCLDRPVAATDAATPASRSANRRSASSSLISLGSNRAGSPWISISSAPSRPRLSSGGAARRPSTHTASGTGSRYRPQIHELCVAKRRVELATCSARLSRALRSATGCGACRSRLCGKLPPPSDA